MAHLPLLFFGVEGKLDSIAVGHERSILPFGILEEQFVF
jgi:hypothetical protein